MSDQSTTQVQQQLGVPWEYEDARGIKITDSGWTCPDCGDSGRLMHRPASKETCATCFYVVDGKNNDYQLDDIGVPYRRGQRLLAAVGERWGGSPGDVANRLRAEFVSVSAAREAAESLEEVRST